jgi:HAMP domain-containing protein
VALAARQIRARTPSRRRRLRRKLLPARRTGLFRRFLDQMPTRQIYTRYANHNIVYDQEILTSLAQLLLEVYGKAVNMQRQIAQLKRARDEADQDDDVDAEDAHRNKATRNDEVEEMEAEVKRLGRKLCIMHALWLPSSSHLSDIVDAPLPDVRPDPLDRYRNAETELLADRFDYRDILGERVFELLSDRHVRRLVRFLALPPN